jgi:pilus assembly protein CpaB
MVPFRLSAAAARLGGWPRRVVALACLVLAAAVALAEHPAAPAAGPVATAPVVVAAVDLAGGAELRANLLRVTAWPTTLRPIGAFGHVADLIGRRLAGPARSGEAVTPTRLAGPGLTTGLPTGYVAAPAPIAASSIGLVHAGDRVDLMAPAADEAPNDLPARLVADGVAVLAVLPPIETGSPGAGTLVVAADRATAARIAASASSTLIPLVRAPPS